MALLEDLFKTNPVTGLAIGIGVVLIGPAILGVAGQVIRPAAKAAIKGGLLLYDQLAEIGAVAGDLFSEAQDELEANAGTAVAIPEQNPGSSSGPAKRPRKRST